MDHQLKLTARGHAVYELMAEYGLSLDAACARVEQELATLRERLEQILSDGPLADVAAALEVALSGVSIRVQSAYLEELDLSGANASSVSATWLESPALH